MVYALVIICACAYGWFSGVSLHAALREENPFEAPRSYVGLALFGALKYGIGAAIACAVCTMFV